MNAQKVSTLISRQSIFIPRIRYQRSFATDKKEPHGSGLHGQIKDQPHETNFATVGAASEKEALSYGPGGHQQHSLASQYKERIQPSRIGREADPMTGKKPTISQKYFLILTRLYKQQSDIPEYVPNQTMNKMHNRMRAVVILTAFTLFYLIAYTSEWRTRRQMDIDKASGKVVRTYADIKS